MKSFDTYLGLSEEEVFALKKLLDISEINSEELKTLKRKVNIEVKSLQEN